MVVNYNYCLTNTETIPTITLAQGHVIGVVLWPLCVDLSTCLRGYLRVYRQRTERGIVQPGTPLVLSAAAGFDRKTDCSMVLYNTKQNIHLDFGRVKHFLRNILLKYSSNISIKYFLQS